MAKSEDLEEFLSIRCYEGYKYSFKKIKPYDAQTQLREEYSEYLKDQLQSCMKQVNNVHSTQSYNFFMGKNWMMVVLRKKEKIFDVVSFNALGVLGSVFVKNEQYKQICIKKLPSEILKEILVSVDDYELYKMKF